MPPIPLILLDDSVLVKLGFESDDAAKIHLKDEYMPVSSVIPIINMARTHGFPRIVLADPSRWRVKSKFSDYKLKLPLGIDD